MNNKDFFEDKVIGNVDQLKTGISKTHKKLVKVSEETVSGVLEAGEQWQNVLARSLKKGTKFLGSQQELVFETLEGIKKVHQTNVKKIKELADLKTAKKAIKKTVKETKQEVAEVKEVVKAEIIATQKEVKQEVKAAKKAVKKAVTKTKKEVQDLKVINGIGPKLEGILNDAGIQSLSDLANTPVKKLEAILAEAGPRYKSFSPKEWLKQIDKKLK
ncbi:MAG: hypothetical protein Sapg2KO_50350 [Saprospiraceae bacterium]